MAPDLYDVLGVDPDAGADDVAAAYRDRAATLHPDVNDHPRAREQFTLLTTARDVLADPEERADYDRMGHETYVQRRLDRSLPPPTVLDDVAPASDGRSGDDGRDGDQRTPGRASGEDDPPSGGGSHTAGPTAGASGAAESSPDAESVTGPGAGRRKRPADAGRATGGSAGEEGSGGRTRTASAGGTAGAGTASGGDQSSGASGRNGSAGASGASGRTAERDGTGGSARSRSRGQSEPGPPPDDGRTEADEGFSWVQARRRGAARRERAYNHLDVSLAYVPLVCAAALYGWGLAVYLGAQAGGLRRAAAAVLGGGLRSVRVLHARRFGVETPLSFARRAGFGADPLARSVDAGLLLGGGAVALAAVVLVAVARHRRTTNWSPSWLYVLGAAGPLSGAGLAAYGVGPGRPLATVPLWADLLLAAVLPALAVLAYLLYRFVLIVPLYRLEK
jgi:molecular chaperone DnaJ